jgi:hypothetical protein
MSWVAVALLVAASVYWHVRRVKRAVARWAQRHGCKVLEYHQAFLPSLPPLGLAMRTWRTQTLVHIRVYDEASRRIRQGWMRLGTFWGFFEDEATEVFWADE